MRSKTPEARRPTTGKSGRKDSPYFLERERIEYVDPLLEHFEEHGDSRPRLGKSERAEKAWKKL